MSQLIPHSFFPRSAFDMDFWRNPLKGTHSTIDLFDSFDDLDHMMARNMQWLNKPHFMGPTLTGVARVPHKFRIVVDCPGFQASSITTEIKNNFLYVSGREEEKHHEDDFSIKEFKKKYELPENCETDKLVSFMTTPGHLVIEMPIREHGLHLNKDLFPKIVQDTNGNARVTLDFQVPQNIHPEKVHIHVKDRDLIVKAQDEMKKGDTKTKFFFYKRTTLPENTDFKSLNCEWDNHRISVNAPLINNAITHKQVPIEHKHAINN